MSKLIDLCFLALVIFGLWMTTKPLPQTTPNPIQIEQGQEITPYEFIKYKGNKDNEPLWIPGVC